MPKRVQHVRHNTSAADLYIGLEGQLTWDITKGEWRGHDGSTPGGVPVARADLQNVSAATNANDGKMTSTLVGNLEQVISDLNDLEVIVGALDAGDIDFDDTGLNVVAVDVQSALAAYDALIVANDVAINAALDAHIANVSNPHQVTATQVGLGNVSNDAQLKIASNLADLNNPETARANIGLPDGAQGEIIYYDASANPAKLAVGATAGLSLKTGAAGANPYWGRSYYTEQIFTINGTWNRPTNCIAVEVHVVGPGGNGGGAAASSQAGSGGGAGGYARKLIDVSAIASATIVVGTGGSGTASSWDDGTNTVTGGAGSNGASNLDEVSASNGTAGGTATGGDINLPGGRGEPGAVANGRAIGGGGGSNHMGQGGCKIFRGGNGATNGVNGLNYGGGASGGARVNTGTAVGGSGANGIVIVREFY